VGGPRRSRSSPSTPPQKSRWHPAAAKLGRILCRRGGNLSLGSCVLACTHMHRYGRRLRPCQWIGRGRPSTAYGGGTLRVPPPYPTGFSLAGYPSNFWGGALESRPRRPRRSRRPMPRERLEVLTDAFDQALASGRIAEAESIVERLARASDEAITSALVSRMRGQLAAAKGDDAAATDALAKGSPRPAPRDVSTCWPAGGSPISADRGNGPATLPAPGSRSRRGWSWRTGFGELTGPRSG